MTDAEPTLDRRGAIGRVLRRHATKLRRKVEALQGDLAEARRGPEFRRHGEALLAYLKQVPSRAERVTLPDPHDPARNLEIELDPKIAPQANAARFFKRAAKSERGLKQVPARLAAVEAEAHALEVLITRLTSLEEAASDSARSDDATLDRDLEAALARLPEGSRDRLPAVPRTGPGSGDRPTRAEAAARAAERAPSAKLQPRRLRTREGWDVMIGRNNDGNDYLTHHLARPEDYWFHVHGAAGSHVVLRRGKGKNEPSKQTVEEVAAWAAYHSQARTAGKVPVIVTLKKYVRKPRKGPPGLALCTQEKSVMVRPQEPPREALANEVAVEGGET